MLWNFLEWQEFVAWQPLTIGIRRRIAIGLLLCKLLYRQYQIDPSILSRRGTTRQIKRRLHLICVLLVRHRLTRVNIGKRTYHVRISGSLVVLNQRCAWLVLYIININLIKTVNWSLFDTFQLVFLVTRIFPHRDLVLSSWDVPKVLQWRSRSLLICTVNTQVMNIIYVSSLILEISHRGLLFLAWFIRSKMTISLVRAVGDRWHVLVAFIKLSILCLWWFGGIGIIWEVVFSVISTQCLIAETLADLTKLSWLAVLVLIKRIRTELLPYRLGLISLRQWFWRLREFFDRSILYDIFSGISLDFSLEDCWLEIFISVRGKELTLWLFDAFLSFWFIALLRRPINF